MANVNVKAKNDEVEWETLERKFTPVWGAVEGEVVIGTVAEVGKVTFRSEGQPDRTVSQYKVDLVKPCTLSIMAGKKLEAMDFQAGDIITLPSASDLLNQLEGNMVGEGKMIYVEVEGTRHTGFGSEQKLFVVKVALPKKK